MIQLRLSSHSEVLEFRTRSADACELVLFLSVLVKFRFMSEEEFMKPVVIVGAGLSGLTCAKILHESGISVTVLEKSDGFGGRVRTDEMDGFLLDRGFQVFLDAYPEAGEVLDLAGLNLQSFEPGALVFDGNKLNRVMDIFRRPQALLKSTIAPVGSVFDKLRVAVLRQKILDLSYEQIFKRPDQSTESYLRGCGFSDNMIVVFFRSFYGGIFLERGLKTSSRMFEFTFRMFSLGSATVPAMGMGEIPKQLASALPGNSVRLNCEVASVRRDQVSLLNGEILEASHVVVAAEASATAELIEGFAPEAPDWRAVTNLYFSADFSPLNEAIIALNGTGEGLVNNVAVMSDVSSQYAPDGKSLVSVSVLGLCGQSDLPARVLQEMRDWFGDQVDDWRHLRTDQIRHALPSQRKTEPRGVREFEGILVCGDHVVSASIEGAISSGKIAAEKILTG